MLMLMNDKKPTGEHIDVNDKKLYRIVVIMLSTCSVIDIVGEYRKYNEFMVAV